jgi:hypothetical protein
MVKGIFNVRRAPTASTGKVCPATAADAPVLRPRETETTTARSATVSKFDTWSTKVTFLGPPNHEDTEVGALSDALNATGLEVVAGSVMGCTGAPIIWKGTPFD